MTVTTVTHRWIKLSHGWTRYIDAGSGPPLLVLHLSSLESGADDCLPTLDVLTPQFRVIAPDLIGWPPSDAVDDVDAFPRIVDFLREFQDALEITRWHVCGASMGGWIAGLFAYESPERCEGVVIGGHPFTGAPNHRMTSYTAVDIASDDRVREWVTNATEGQGVDTKALVLEKLARIHEPGFGDKFAKIMRTMGDPANREHYAMIHRLPRMRLPVLILLGERDQAAMGLKGRLSASAPTAEIKVVASGHRIHIEDPELFASTVRDFLRRPRA